MTVHVTSAHYNAAVRIHSSAPTRIDLAGGTLDIWPLYLLHENAQTINVAITRRAECFLSNRPDQLLSVSAEDTNTTAKVANARELNTEPNLKLLAKVLGHFQASGMAIKTRSRSPVGAGLAGSSALNIALCAGLARWKHQELAPEQLMALALDLEAQAISAPTGLQDYRPATYGGIAAIELIPGGVKHVPLKVNIKEFNKRLVLVYTGQSRNSGINNWEVTKQHIDGNRKTIEAFDRIRDVTTQMRKALEDEDWQDVSTLINYEWELRKSLAPGISTNQIDFLITQGLKSGALAAKICGAGGGGCIFFLSKPDRTEHVRESLSAAGAHLLDCQVDANGVCVTVETE